MLKIYTLLMVVAALATLSTCMILHVPGVVEKCRAELNVTEAELDQLFQNLSEDTDGLERRFKCFIKCLYNGLKLTDDNGRLDAIKFASQDPLEPTNEHAAEIANSCNAKFSSVEEQCENLYKVVFCISLQLQHMEEEQKVFELIQNNFTDVEKISEAT